MGSTDVSLRVAVRMFLASQDKRQWWLAEQVGVDESTVSRWLSGRAEPTEKQAERLERITGIPAQRFARTA